MKCVVKLGGSLVKNDEILNCLKIIERWTEPTIIVPGGGAFADTVRQSQAHWQFNDSIAHRMAILAMQQTALLLHGLSPKMPIFDSMEFQKCDALHSIWSPRLADLDCAGLPHSWDLSSDSLAAWLATRWQADRLILVKSAPISQLTELSAMQQNGIVDAAFTDYCDPSKFEIKILNYAQLADVHD